MTSSNLTLERGASVVPIVAAAPPAEAPRPHLLIADDVADNRTILARRFQKRGFDITEADCGGRALELIAEQSFDLVLLDVMMPDMNGLEVLQEIRKTYSPVALPVIMVTAKTQSEDVAEALQLGANDYLTKPVDFVVALARVNTQVGWKKAEQTVYAANEALRHANEDLEARVAERTARLLELNQSLSNEIAHRQQTEAKIRHLAHHDALTGLGNRLLFREQLEEGLIASQCSGTPLSILFIDLDGFKAVNDTLGHSMGDALLENIADRLRDHLAETDRIARLGGDEFAILQMTGEQPTSSAALASRVIDLISTPCTIDGHQVTVGASVGIAVSPADGSDPDQLLRSADLAMYRAKGTGRGTYRFFEPEMDARAQTRRTLEFELRNALAAGALQLFYQPIVTVETNRVSGFEALLRWNHPQRGMVSPGEFIPLAEEIGLIIPIGEWALRQACAEAATWPGEVKVAVNLSPIQFQSANLVPTVISALATSGLPAQRLELEITETVMLEKTDSNLAILHQLRALGVRISMDDFGTGYSSLSYLRGFRFDKIKIDQSFIRDLSREENSRVIVRAIAGLGTSFGITTTAEGVETQEQLNCLRSEGCTEVQGYFFSRPKPASEVRAILADIEGTVERLAS